MLSLQYCARHYYNFAEYLNYISWLICILTTVVFTLPPVTEMLGSYKVIWIVIINLLAIVIDVFYGKLIQIGAACKMLFDYKLFNFSEVSNYQGLTLEKIYQQVAKTIMRYKKSYESQINNRGIDKIKGVKDWYYNISKDLSHEEAVRECQKQNLNFDIQLIKRTVFLYVFLFVIIIILLIIFDVNTPLITILINISAGFALIKKMISVFWKLGKLILHNQIIEDVSQYKNVDLIMIQKMIDNRRIVCVSIPNFMHKINLLRIHREIDISTSMDVMI